MNGDGLVEARGSLWSSWASLLASAGTLVCCAIPAALVALGAGAALSSLIAVFPQVVWLSERKEELFALAGVMLAVAGWLQWRNRSAPCPVDPGLRAACLRTRKASLRIYLASLLFYLVGGWFAFLQPWLANPL